MINKIQSVLKNEGLDIQSVKMLDKGTNKNSYIVTAKKGKFIVKLYKEKDKSSVQKQLNWLRAAHKIANVTIYPLNDKLLKIGPKLGFYYEYFPGVPINQTKINNVFLWFGKVAGRFNQVLKRVAKSNLTPTFWSEDEEDHVRGLIKDLQKHNPKLAKLMQKAYDTILNALKEIKIDKCRMQLLHSDLHFDNVLYDSKTKIAKVIDIDGIDFYILPREIAITLSYALEGKKGTLYETAITDLLKGYQSVVKLNKQEKKLLAPLIIKRKITELAWLHGQLKSGNHTQKEFETFSAHTISKLTVAMKHFSKLTELTSK